MSSLCFMFCLVFINVCWAELSIDVCKTDEKLEDCAKSMKLDQISNYPFTQMNEWLYFKITNDHASHPNILLWPYNCHLLGVEETPSVHNIIVEKGCPTRGQMSISMDNIDPIKVGFVLSHIIGSKEVQESMYIKCHVIECVKNGRGSNCPKSHCSNTTVSSWDDWTGRKQLAVSKGYLFLDNFHAGLVPPPRLSNEVLDKADCQKKLDEFRDQCEMFVAELLFFPHIKKN